MRLEMENGASHDVTTEADVRSSLAKLNGETNTFAILTSGGENYVQAAVQKAGFLVERRSGSFESHRSARVRGSDALTQEIVAEIFSAYLMGRPMPAEVEWRKVELPAPDSIQAATHSARGYLLLALPFVLLAAILVWRYYPR
ncbi:MAG TPA: hypothetical protein VF631_06465 [Allosphingosinicella sp.]|jgi:hypothetical protein|uniref:hypothetical protein n=1 Tax=Allosphingosinicella sp. TaxID=2823234 RepID=UPI002F283844